MTFLNGILTISIANADELNLISTGAQAGVAGAFMAWIIWQAKTYASQLAGVGVEGAMQGSRNGDWCWRVRRFPYGA